MSWTDRQRSMLAEMGIRLWPDPPRDGPAPLAPDRPSEKDGGGPARSAASPCESVPAAPPSPATRVDAKGSGELGARPAGVEAMDWPALRKAVAGCTACGLCRGRRQAVFGVGHERAHWLIVGEAPGEQEDRQGEPFVGASGQLLDSMLRAVGLSRQANPEGDPARQVFIANVMKCRPPVNRNPRPEEVVQCSPFLKRQVALVQPRLILAMGRFAVQALLDTDAAIGKLRGQVHRYEGVPVVVTYHPAYLLRNLPDKARAWEDLCLAREVAAAPR
jgi:uracil-DNA glycosylase family 4